MDGFCGGNNAKAQAVAMMQAQQACEKPEITLAKLFKDDLGIDVNPQALRLFVRWRFDRVSPLAHRIHRGD